MSKNNKDTLIQSTSKMKLSELKWFSDSTFRTASSFECPKCKSTEYDIDSIGDNNEASLSTFKCSHCGAKFTYREIIEIAVMPFQSFKPFNSEWIAIDPKIRCESCGGFYDSHVGHICYFCGHVQKCKICGKSIELDDVSSYKEHGKCKECSRTKENNHG